MLEIKDKIEFAPNSEGIFNSFESEDWLVSLKSDDSWDIGHGRFQVLVSMGYQYQITKHAMDEKSRSSEIYFSNPIAYTPKTFPEYISHNIDGNNIVSIEPLCCISLPALEVLTLKENEIRSISSLRKCYMPSLTEISLYKNKICDIEKLTELKATKLSFIWLNGKLEDGNIISSMNWVAKIESNAIKDIYNSHEKRIPQIEVTQALNKKFNREVAYSFEVRDDHGLNWL